MASTPRISIHFLPALISLSPMNLGVQYYRPPFPVQKYWRDDLKRIRDCGLDTLQLWVTWAWVESRPYVFNFSDYDRLVEMAEDTGLEVILSTIAELQPHWIHVAAPGSEMVDNYGNRIISSLREESNFGLTPGGCTEHPIVWERMQGFLGAVVRQYRGLTHLAGWDAWNELRWHEQSDALVCFCPHCLREFRSWLDQRHGGLDGLNAAWLRRYGSWDEVWPGKLHWRTFTEMMEWQRFVTWKANRHGRRRYEFIKSLDPERPVTVHAGDPSPVTVGSANAYALDRGNDWGYADDLDGVGCSSFPKIFQMDDTAFTTRVEFVRAAAFSGGKKLWLSEVQGGRGSMGFQPMAPVTASDQQRWIWRGLAGGADKLLFWCWRDEVFGRESSGFGLAGNDGHASARLEAMTHTSNVLRRYSALFSDFRPWKPEVGVFFSPSSYYLHWALDGTAMPPREALEGYCRSLTRQSIPYLVVEEEHLEVLNDLKILFLPRVIVVSSAMEAALAGFVKAGGVLVCEAECGAFTTAGIYRYPEERFLVTHGLLSGQEAGRRDLAPGGKISCQLPGTGEVTLLATQWITPWRDFPEDGLILADHEDGVVMGEASCGDGRIILGGSFLGDSAYRQDSAAFDAFLGWCCRTREGLPVAICGAATSTPPSYLRVGYSQGLPVVFVFLPAGQTQARLTLRPGFFPSQTVVDLFSHQTYTINLSEELVIDTSEHGIAILADKSSLSPL